MLPIIDYPTYTLTIPSNGKKVKYRPFTVKEQKLLLMALESDEESDMMNAIKQIIINCTMGKIDPEEIAPYDAEYIFIHLRGKSIGEVTQLSYKCKNNVGEKKDKECGHIQQVELNINDIKLREIKEHNPLIEITKDVGFEMGYPSLDSTKPDDTESLIDYLANVIKNIYDGDTIYKGKDLKHEELVEWIESLPQDILDKMVEFISTIPKLETDVHFKCDACGFEQDIHLEGLQDFFA
jgi:hypothetical protein